MHRNTHPLLDTPDWQRAVSDQNAGRFEQAGRQYMQMMRQAPNCPELYCNVAILENLKGNFGLVLALANHAIQLAPQMAEAYFLAGNALLSVGRPKDAETLFRRGVKAAPKNEEGYFHLGNAQSTQGLSTAAEAAFRKGLQLNPDYAEIWLNLGNLLRGQDRLQEALEAFNRCAAVRPDYAFAHNNIGNVLRDLDLLEEAEAAYRRAVKLAPEYDVAHFNLGNALRDQGKVEEAAASFRRAVKINPLYGDAQRHLAITATVKPQDPDIVAMNKVYEDADTPALQRMYMAFGLGFVHDKAGDFDKAFEYLKVANRLKRSMLDYSADSDARFVQQICNVQNKEFFAADKPRGSSGEMPILIVGMMRSGTSLMEQIIASHPDVEGAGELLVMPNLIDPPVKSGNSRSFPHNTLRMSGKQWDLLGKDYVHQVRGRLQEATPYFTDKLPQNFLFLGAFARSLPNTRILHMVRNPLDVCVSIYSQLFTTGHPYAYDLEELGRYYIAYHRLMQHWRDANPGMIMDVPYRQLVGDTEKTVRQVLDYVGLPFDPACLEFHTSKRAVKTASALQVREKVYKSSVARWRNYKAHLSPLMTMFDKAGIDYSQDIVAPLA